MLEGKPLSFLGKSAFSVTLNQESNSFVFMKLSLGSFYRFLGKQYAARGISCSFSVPNFPANKNCTPKRKLQKHIILEITKIFGCVAGSTHGMGEEVISFPKSTH